MINAYKSHGTRLERVDLATGHLRDALWIDLEAPDRAEEDAVEAAVGIGIPTREDMQEIEVSSRFYREGDTLFLTVQVLETQSERDTEIGPATFVLRQDRLVSVHYHQPGSFSHFADWAARHDLPLTSGTDALLGLLETVVDRLADILEGEARKLDNLSKAIFAAHRPSGKGETLGVVLQRIGRAEDLNAKATESLTSLQRLVAYLTQVAEGPIAQDFSDSDQKRARTLAQDIHSLREVATTQAAKIVFLLDATLGVINIRQSDIIKIFSVVAFVFLPPTLIASVYGMNFDVMPELHWRWGYPLALGLMAISAFVPWVVFRWKKWL
jgi:magnesium transporter